MSNAAWWICDNGNCTALTRGSYRGVESLNYKCGPCRFQGTLTEFPNVDEAVKILDDRRKALGYWPHGTNRLIYAN